MKTQREKFEAWISSEVDGSVIAESLCWQAWQAAIESVVVELPPVFDAAAHDAAYYEYAYSQSGIYDALDKAGVKYER